MLQLPLLLLHLQPLLHLLPLLLPLPQLLSTANWEQAQSSFFTFNPLDFAHFCRANDQIDAKGKQLATTAANKALVLQACPPATSGPFALV